MTRCDSLVQLVLLTTLVGAAGMAYPRSLSEFYVQKNVATPPDETEQTRRLNRLGQWFAQDEVTAEGVLTRGKDFNYRFVASFRLEATLDETWAFVEKVEDYEQWVSIESPEGITEFRGIRGRSDRTGFTVYLHFGGLFRLWIAYPFHLSLIRAADGERALLVTFASTESTLARLELDARFEEDPASGHVVVRYGIGMNLDWKELFVSRRFVKRELIPMASALLLSLRSTIGGEP